MRLAPLAAILFALLASLPSLAQKRPEQYVTRPAEGEQQRVRDELGPGFRVLETAHFRVLSDTSPRYHTVIAGLLEQFHELVHPRFFVRDLRPVDFYLIDDGKAYERFVRERGLPNAAGYGLYEPRSRTLYARRYFPDGRESGVGTLFHETLHAMLDADFETAPPRWINEGFASLFEVGRVVQGQWVYGNPNPWRETPFRAAFEAGRVPSLAALLATPDAAFGAEKPAVDLLYNSGRSLFLYLLRNHGEPVIADFLRRVRAAEPAQQALVAATSRTLPELEARWHESIRSVNFGGDYVFRARGPDAIRILEEGARLHPQYGELALNLAIALMGRGELPNALSHAQRALRDPHLIHRQRAHFVVARSILTSDANAAARELASAIALQPWNEELLGSDYELLAFMHEKMGRADQAAALRAELEELEQQDRSAARGRP